MMGQRPARVLAPADVCLVLAHVEGGGDCSRNKAMMTLSVYAGLRACELAGLTWPMALRADGEVDRQLRIADAIAKNGCGRSIPMHPELALVLRRLHRQSGRPREGPIIVSARGHAMTAKEGTQISRKSDAGPTTGARTRICRSDDESERCCGSGE